MDELVKSIQIWLKEKTGSPLYFTYTAFLVVWNWKFFFTLFFEDATLLNSPRIEYVAQNLEFHVCNSKISIYPWCSIAEWLTNAAWHILIPVALTYAAIKYLPKLHAWAHKIHVQNHFSRKEEWDKQSLDYEQKRTKTLEEEVKERGKQQPAKKAIQKDLTIEERWEEEYEEFSKGRLFKRFDQIIDVIYDNNGYLSGNSNKKLVDSDVLAGAHTRSLISFVDQYRNQIDFTEKGKIFAKKYLDNPPLPF